MLKVVPLCFSAAMSIQQLKSNMYGFGINPKSAQKVIVVFKTPQVIPSQILDYNAFPLSATRSGIQSKINMHITNCTCISIMFPKHDNDYTVFENPVYNNVQLTVNGKNLPELIIMNKEFLFYLKTRPGLYGFRNVVRVLYLPVI